MLADTLSAVENSDLPQVSVGSSGVVIAVWHAVNPVSMINTVYSARKTIGGLWSSAQTISNGSLHSNYPQIAVDANGAATAVWFTYTQTNGTISSVNVQSSDIDSQGFGWSTPIDVISSNGLQNPANLVARVAYDANGNAIAAWSTSLDGSTFTVQSSSRNLNKDWSIPVDLAIDIYAYAIDIKVTGSGSAFAVYMLTDPNTSNISIESAENQMGNGEDQFWAFPTVLSEASATRSPAVSAVLVGNANQTVAAWIGYDGMNDIVQVSSGVDTLIAPPTNLSVVQNVNQFGVFDEYYNTLSWTASVDPNVIFYAIYRDGIFFQKVPASTTQIIDHNRMQNRAVTYGVAAIDGNHGQSRTATVSFP